MARLRVDIPRSSSRRLRETSDANSPSGSPEGAPWPACDILNTTFSFYRTSPLFVGQHGLSEDRLRALEAQLLDILTGESARGIEFGLAEDRDSSMGNAGVLETVAIEWVSADKIVATSQPALQMILQYENAQCVAILLPVPETPRTANGAAADPGDAFLSLPLLLLKMPTPLKAIVVRFLSTTFDSRIIALHLTSRDIIRSWESWASATALPTDGPIAKDVVVTLAFNLSERRGVGISGEKQLSEDAAGPTLAKSTVLTTGTSQSSESTDIGLRTIDVSIPNTDLGRFLKAGQHLESDSDDRRGAPFTTALALYLKSHLGLDLFNPAVEVARVACGGFVLSMNRVKIFGFSGSVSNPALNQHQSVIPQIFGDLVLRSLA
ncbi:hypothetical protein SEPCBS119000_004432 [Sporothrix epigloea]|uniref:Siroheme synthase n=1 Tax=Sporothrix epigloea TaxID=1892477 RepID=A0ABP0DW45_9PEZI